LEHSLNHVAVAIKKTLPALRTGNAGSVNYYPPIVEKNSATEKFRAVDDLPGTAFQCSPLPLSP
jgi:hypothetical protein